MSAQHDHLVTRAEASKRLCVSERYLDQLLDRGVLARVKLGAAVRVRASDLDRLMTEGVPREREGTQR